MITVELDTPTIALVLPMNFERWNSFSVTNASPNEAKFAYIKLNTQTPCSPRGALLLIKSYHDDPDDTAT
jgi:hypothetical protein